MFRSAEIGRVHRERLVQNGFLSEVIKGWLPDRPTLKGRRYHPLVRIVLGVLRPLLPRTVRHTLAPLAGAVDLLHAEATAISVQVIVNSPKGTNNMVRLLFGTSLYDLKQKQMPPPGDIVEKQGLRLFAVEAALIKVPEAFFQRSAVEAQVALASIRDVLGNPRSSFRRRPLAVACRLRAHSVGPGVQHLRTRSSRR